MNDIVEIVGIVGSTALVTRDQGRLLKHHVAAMLPEGRSVVLDLEGAEAVSPSFADEFFGGLLEDLGTEEFRRRVQVRGMTPDVRVLLNRVLAYRSARVRRGQ